MKGWKWAVAEEANGDSSSSRQQQQRMEHRRSAQIEDDMFAFRRKSSHVGRKRGVSFLLFQEQYRSLVFGNDFTF